MIGRETVDESEHDRSSFAKRKIKVCGIGIVVLDKKKGVDWLLKGVH
jgi:hypothetical protein